MIRWIDARLGTAPANSPDLSEAQAVLDVRDLVDKAGNDPALVRERIDAGVALIGGARPLVVCCDYGMSRSNAVAAGVLALADDLSLDEALQRVMTATGEREIKLEPIASVRAALADDRRHKDGAPAGRSRVLVTGGSGFIGTQLIAALDGTAEVIVAAGGELELEAGALKLALLAERHRIDQIVHLANPRVYTSNRAMGLTLSMLRNTLEVCRATQARLIYLSSWELYSGYRATELIADETLPPRPKGPYGETKLLAERLIELHQERHGLNASIVRPAPVFGMTSDKPKFIFNFIRKARSQAATIATHRYRNGWPALDLLHVDDLVSALTALVERRAQGNFNLGGGELLPIREVASRIVAACDASTTTTYHDVDDDVANVRMDSARASLMLGWRPKRRFDDILPDLIAAVARADG